MDGLIYDNITITIDDPCWVDRANNATLLIIHIIFRPRQSDKPLKQYDLLSLHKLTVEGQIFERKTCLDWEIQTRYIWVVLPREK